MNEFEIIARYFTRPTDDRDVLLGVGDDAAVLGTTGPIAVAVDTLVAGVHFPDGTGPDSIAHRALAVNLSDLAAMGARPRWFTLALTLPDADPAWLEAFAAGLFALADRYGVSLVGGDLTRGPLTVSIQVIGTMSGMGAGAIALTRGGGRVGDDVYVTGTLGDAAAGLAVLTGRYGEDAATGAAREALAARFLRPEPRVGAGLALVGVATAAIDVSDGLAADLGHLCDASGCGAEIDVENLPLSAEIEAVCPIDAAESHAIAGGDDYELCFTAPPSEADRVAAAIEQGGIGARRIGRLVEGRNVAWRRAGKAFTPPDRGYVHFR
ncbi:MAG: thiamine-phosphate kinase [Gammaproteobacteria bacterium]|nr:thiamine-phosphate kinase [Gammaproteobacteria bacterium]